jgi:hypothetical protein
MAFNFNGVGTTLYGKRDFRADGSYITTEWFVFVYLPIVPRRSLRILPTGRETHLGVYDSTEYRVLDRLKLHWGQAVCTYAFVVGWWAWMALSLDVLGRELSAFAVGMLPALVPFLLRRHARTALRGEVATRQS